MHSPLWGLTIIIYLQLDNLIGKPLTLIYTTDEWMIVSVGVDGSVDEPNALLDLVLLLLEVGEDLVVLLVGVGELWFDGLKVGEYFLVLSSSFLVADHVVGILEDLVVHLVQVLTG